MKSSRRLRPVARIAMQRERNAARQLGNTLRHVDQQKKQLENLKTYREQYLHTFHTAGQAGLSVVRLRDFKIFLKRLDEAIVQQKQTVQASFKNCAQSKKNWRDKYGRSKMINKVIEKKQSVEIKEQNNHEQREQDDRVKKG